MHVALLTNRAWLDEELTPFQHLVVGLIDERVRVAQVVPEDVSPDDLSAFGDHVVWRESTMPMLNQHRLSGLDEALGALGVDLIHAMDGRLWRSGLKLAAAMDVPIVLSAYSMLDVRLSQKVLPGRDPARVAVTAATEPIINAIRPAAPDDMLLATVGTGVHSHEARTAPPKPDQSLCVIVCGNGVLDPDYETLLRSIADFIELYPTSQFFFDGQGSGQHQIWKAANAMGLLGNISLTPRRIGHRNMLLRSHALIHPQALGRARSLTLRAMARGMPVIARQDPALDYLIHDQNAIVLDQPDAGDWTEQLIRLVDQPDWFNKLGQSAAQWVHEHRPSSHQINGILDIYRRITGQTIPFEG